jgi:hypothetical protein
MPALLGKQRVKACQAALDAVYYTYVIRSHVQGYTGRETEAERRRERTSEGGPHEAGSRLLRATKLCPRPRQTTCARPGTRHLDRFMIRLAQGDGDPRTARRPTDATCADRMCPPLAARPRDALRTPHCQRTAGRPVSRPEFCDRRPAAVPAHALRARRAARAGS